MMRHLVLRFDVDTEESAKIQAIAKETVPGITTMALPQGLQVEKGPDDVFNYILEKLPGLIGS